MEGISEMTYFLAKTFQSRFGGQSDEIVSDRQNRPVCLDAVPGSHKHLAEAEVLLDVLVKDFDRKALRVKFHHLGLGHFQIVGDKETIIAGCARNKKSDVPDPGKPDEQRGDLEILLFGNPDAFVNPPSLGQKRHGRFDAVEENVTILFQSAYEDSARFLNGIENRRTGIPGVHHHDKSSRKQQKSFSQNLERQSDFAFESARSAGFLGPVSPKSKDQAQGTRFQKTSYGAQSFHQPLGSMMKPNALDMFSISWRHGVVEDQKRILRILDSCLTKCRDYFLKLQDDSRRFLNEVMKAVGISRGKMSRNFPDRPKFDQIQEAGQINQKVNALRLAQNLQERFQIGRNYFRAIFAHGLRVLRLRGLVSIGDFDRKPFYLKGLSSFFT